MMKQNDILYARFLFRGRHYVCLRVDVDYALNVHTVYAAPILAKSERLRADFLEKPMKRISGTELSEIQVMHAQQLEGRYYPATETPCQSLDLITPDAMDYETEQALLALKRDVGGDTVAFACDQLRCTPEELRQFLSAEQVDAVCMAIRAIQKGGGFILGDQTGVGKGRVAAATIRYAVENGQKPPIFFTIKPNLFSDIYRDLCALGCAHYKPYIVNAANSGILDADGKVVYAYSNNPKEGEYNYILCTYSQINSEKVSGERRNFISDRAKDAICILDESHSASGASSTTDYMYKMLSLRARGVLFMSATFAKRPDNMLLYCSKTILRDVFETDANGKLEKQREAIETAFANGGVPLQEVVASQLVASGQMLRRERNFSGVEVDYITLDSTAKPFGLRDYSREHTKYADAVTGLIRRILKFQKTYIQDIIDTYNSKNSESSTHQRGREKLGMTNTSLFSRLFHIVDTLLFSLKAEATADLTIERIRKGEKVIIAFSKTNESLLDSMDEQVTDDFSQVLINALDSTLVVKNSDGGLGTYTMVLELQGDAKKEYESIKRTIRNTFRSGGILLPASPIDYIVDRLEHEGIAVAELTGRKTRLHGGVIENREVLNVTKTFQDFNNNLIDVLLINQTASTGASAHAVATPLVPVEKVKRRCMIVLQSELDINTEIQKRGRINRTGQVLSPIYLYLHSAIPAEKRLAMMLQAKLKSLDANTTSSQKNTQKNEHTQHDDFINKYGDKVVYEWLKEHDETAALLGYDIDDSDDKKKNNPAVNVARQATGRVAILSTEEQEAFYGEVLEAYNEFIKNLKFIGQYDLEMDSVKLNAKTLDVYQLTDARSNESEMLGPVFIELCEVDNLVRPYSGQAVAKMVSHEIKRLVAKFGANANGLPNVDAIVGRVKADFDTHLREAAGGKKSDQLSEKEQKRLAKKKKAFDDALDNLRFFLRSVEIGRIVLFPNERSEQIYGVFTSIEIGNKAMPSTVKIGFTIADVRRTFKTDIRKQAVEGSFSLASIVDRYQRFSQQKSILSEDAQKDWDRQLTLTGASSNRTRRYIITGSMLRAYALPGCKELMQKIISYTTSDGRIRKGALCHISYEKVITDKYFPLQRGNGTDRKRTAEKRVPLNSSEFITLLRKASPSEDVRIFRKGDRDGVKILASVSTQHDGVEVLIVRAVANKKADLFWLVKDQELMSLSQRGGFWGYRVSHGLTDIYADIGAALKRLDELGCVAQIATEYDEKAAIGSWKQAQQAQQKDPRRITPILGLELKLFLDNGGGKQPSSPINAAMSTRAALTKLASSQCNRTDLLPLFTELKRATDNFTTDKKLDSKRYNLRNALRVNNVRSSDWLNANKTIDRSEVDSLIWLASQIPNTRQAEEKKGSQHFDYEAAAAKALYLKAMAMKMKLKMAIN